jgi:hypothetical protein
VDANHRSKRARDEGIVVAIVSSIFFALNISACEPVWVSTKRRANTWLLQESATVCIEVSENQIPKVTEAIKGWDLAIGNWKHLIPSIGINDYCDYKIKEVETPLFQNSNALATTSAIGGREIELYRGRYEIDTRTVVLHELGHAFGARHIEGTLMAPQLTKFIYRCPDAATIAQVAATNGIDPSFFSWCIPY